MAPSLADSLRLHSAPRTENSPDQTEARLSPRASRLLACSAGSLRCLEAAWLLCKNPRATPQADLGGGHYSIPGTDPSRPQRPGSSWALRPGTGRGPCPRRHSLPWRRVLAGRHSAQGPTGTGAKFFIFFRFIWLNPPPFGATDVGFGDGYPGGEGRRGQRSWPASLGRQARAAGSRDGQTAASYARRIAEVGRRRNATV